MARGGEKKGWEPASGFSELREASRGGAGQDRGRTIVTHTGCSIL